MIRGPLDGSHGHLTLPSCERTAKGRTNKSESSPRSPRVGPGSGARHTATPPGHAPNVGECRYMRMSPPRPAETLLRPAETNTSHTDNTLWENLARVFTLLQGFGGYTRGCASTPSEQHNNQEGRKSYQQAPASPGS
jgi:hypothetical protein